ncbi:MAG: glycosyltransferase family 2 protein, partial [Thermoleophilia bacterium]|nr:glycosyltransferase family 2 protein [Thermoleophilia bacterium]
MPRVSVLMPTFERAAFIPRAIESVFAQTLEDWELVVVDDGSADATPAAVEPYLDDQRIRYDRLERNLGLGAALNRGLTLAEGELVAYLPDDDVYYVDHLVSLADRLEASPDAPLAYSGVRHHYNRAARERAEGFALQLVQVMHRATAERWVERSELVTDDLERMLWGRLRKHGEFVATGQVTCEWVDHPG